MTHHIPTQISGRRVRRAWPWRWWLLCLTVALSCAWGAEDILDIRPTVRATRADIQLRDLVLNQAALTPEQAEQVILPAPDFGTVTQLSLVDLAYRLQTCPGLMAYRLRGPEQIVIQGGVDAALAARCRADVIEAIESTAPWSHWQVQVRFDLDDERMLSGVDSSYSSVAIHTRDGALLLGPVDLDVVFLDRQGTVVSECALQPTILREVSALMVAESCERGQVLAAEDVRETAVWLGSESKHYVTDPAVALGSELNRAMAAGELLRGNHLSAPMCSRRGDLVKVTCQSGGITISISAIALDNGRLGDTIRLRNTTSDVVFRARLEGRKRAACQTD